jgi:UDP-glucose 4-epimerase
MNRILVTGCAGFIGFHLVRELLEKGYDVLGIDNFSAYYETSIKEKKFSKLIKYKNFEGIKGDLNFLDIGKLYKDVQIVYHLAGQPGVRGSWGDDFVNYLDNNCLVTQKMLSALGSSDIEHFIFASSSSVYGDVTGDLKEDIIVSPISPYGVTKLFGENLCRVFKNVNGTEITALRFFTVYGPGQRPDMAINKLIRCVFSNDTFDLNGDGYQSRDFTYIDDLISALMIVGLNKSIKTGFGIYNIGSGVGISLQETIEIIEEITKKKIKVNYLNPSRGDVKATLANIEKIRNEFGWDPQYSFTQGVSNQIFNYLNEGV